MLDTGLVFSRQHMGKNKFITHVDRTCYSERIRVEGVREWKTTHSTRGTVLYAFCKSSHADSAIKLGAGHRSN